MNLYVEVTVKVRVSARLPRLRLTDRGIQLAIVGFGIVSAVATVIGLF